MSSNRRLVFTKHNTLLADEDRVLYEIQNETGNLLSCFILYTSSYMII